MIKKLEQYLKTIMPHAQDIYITEFTKMPEGYSYETYIFRMEGWEKGQLFDRNLVMRMEPEAGVVEPYDICPQYYAIRALADTPVPVPKVYRLELDRKVLGRPFFIMDKVDGEVPIPWGFLEHEVYNDPIKRRGMGKNLVEVLAHLHMVDWKALGLDKYLECPEPGTDAARREIDRWEKNLEKFSVRPEPILIEALLWLKENMPAAPKLTIVHGDYRLGNFIWRNEQIVAFLDWEMVAIGDPISDLAWLCMRSWSPLDPSKACYLLERIEVYKYYQELTGIEVNDNDILYWEVLSHFKLAIILICGRRAYLDKKNRDIRLISTNSLLLDDLEEIIRLLNF